jgi:predicted DCC family thiol-disulfide oxidoreductase YuxK
MKVYYNSACPVCKAGIEGQKQRMEACRAAVDFIDVHAEPEAVKEIGAEREFVRERLHVMDESGQVLVGADAFAVIWQRTDGQRWLGRLVQLPLIRPLTAWLYNWFAARLYAWNRRNGRWTT